MLIILTIFIFKRINIYLIFNIIFYFVKKYIKKWNYILIFVIKKHILYFVVVFYLIFENWKYILY